MGRESCSRRQRLVNKSWSQEQSAKHEKMVDVEEEEFVEGPEGGWVPGMC
jgi:hypothetical protein